MRGLIIISADGLQHCLKKVCVFVCWSEQVQGLYTQDWNLGQKSLPTQDFLNMEITFKYGMWRDY